MNHGQRPIMEFCAAVKFLAFSKDKLEEARKDIEMARKLDPDDLVIQMVERKLRLVLDGPDWPVRYECETKHYRIWTNSSQAFADRVGENAELIRRLYLQIFPDPPKAKRKFPIVVFKNKGSTTRTAGQRGNFQLCIFLGWIHMVVPVTVMVVLHTIRKYLFFDHYFN